MASTFTNIGCAIVGVAGWKLNVPEPVMFALFVALFVGYHFQMSRAFRDRQVATAADGA
jgi:hypothetical protein